jgi:4a-hydroxytetrahydrobiopterin dehydratase
MLAAKRCTPPEAGQKKLSSSEAEGLLKQVRGWTMLDSRIERTFKFPDWKTAQAFVDEIGDLAEQEGHHPDIELSWGRVQVRLSTHDLGGLHENDFIMAAKIDSLFPDPDYDVYPTEKASQKAKAAHSPYKSGGSSRSRKQSI